MPDRVEPQIRLTRRCLALGAAALGFSYSTGARAAGLEVIKQRGIANVGTQADYPPFEFIQDGKIVGYDKDLLDAVISEWGVKLNQLDLPFAGLLTGLFENKFDFICTALLILPDRAKRVAYTMPVAVAPIGIWKRKEDVRKITVDDLTGVTIGAVVPPSGPTTMILARNEELKKSGKGFAEIKYFQGSTDLALALANGQVDAWVTTALTMNVQMKKFPDKFELVGFFGDPFYYAWATRPSDSALREAINAGLKRMRDNGDMQKLQQKWFGLTMDVPTSGYLPPDAL